MFGLSGKIQRLVIVTQNIGHRHSHALMMIKGFCIVIGVVKNLRSDNTVNH